MGGGSYSVDAAVTRSTHYASMDTHQIFNQRNINNAMDPNGLTVRESRDSKEHPSSLAIILALDVTGSMGSVPHHLVKKGLPDIMDSIIKSGIKHPQVLFVGIGDHEVDSAPLQIGQFESSDELLDKWLTDIYLEGGGGANAGESYLLAWYFAAYHTSIDCFEKRNQKGILFTIGDEPPLRNVPKSVLQKLMGDGQYENMSASVLLDKARKTYHVYHINIAETASGARTIVHDTWKQLLGDNLLVAQSRNDVPGIIAEVTKKHVKPVVTVGKPPKKEDIIL